MSLELLALNVSLRSPIGARRVNLGVLFGQRVGKLRVLFSDFIYQLYRIEFALKVYFPSKYSLIILLPKKNAATSSSHLSCSSS